MTHVQLSQKVAQEETGVVSGFFGTCGPSAVHGSLVRPLQDELPAKFREKPCGCPVVLARRRRWTPERSGFAVTKRMCSDRVVRRLGGSES